MAELYMPSLKPIARRFLIAELAASVLLIALGIAFAVNRPTEPQVIGLLLGFMCLAFAMPMLFRRITGQSWAQFNYSAIKALGRTSLWPFFISLIGFVPISFLLYYEPMSIWPPILVGLGFFGVVRAVRIIRHLDVVVANHDYRGDW